MLLLLGQNHWIFLISAGPPPPQNNKHLREKNHLNIFKTMRTGCEVAQRLGRERELAENSLDTMGKEQSKTKREREAEREREREGTKKNNRER